MPDSAEPDLTRAGESARTEAADAPSVPTATVLEGSEDDARGRLANDVVERPLFESARKMLESGRSAVEVKKALMDEGLDEESARVVVNSLPGAVQPSTLPEPTMSLSTNALAPDLFSLGELGLSGDAMTVGLYWMVFSAVLLVVLLFVLFVPLPELFGEEGPSDSFLYFIDVVLPPVGFGVVGVAFARGAYLVTRGRRFKLTRKPR
jgi:hypothetical protein